MAPDWLPARASPLTSGTAANAAAAWPTARARSAGGTFPAASAVVSTARTNGHRLRSAAARETSPVSVFPMITAARSRESPCPPGKPASASARPAVSRASQWAGSAARKVRSSTPKPARSNRHPSSSAARGTDPPAEPGGLASRPAPGKAPSRPGGSLRNARRPAMALSNRASGSSASGNLQARPTMAIGVALLPGAVHSGMGAIGSAIVCTSHYLFPGHGNL